METQLIQLLKLGLDLDDFFAITIYKEDVRLLGFNEADKLVKYSKLGYEFKLTLSNHLEANKNKIVITLT
jgi:hypothetical protein